MPDREILHKAKRLDNGEWVEGYYVHNAAGQHMMVGGCYDKSYIMTEVDPSTVCRYTGLTDKHGTRIFEWDRVAVINPAPFNRTTGTVIFADGCFDVVFDRKDFGRDYLKCLVCNWTCEVIGNRWDNQELMPPPPGEEKTT